MQFCTPVQLSQICNKLIVSLLQVPVASEGTLPTDPLKGVAAIAVEAVSIIMPWMLTADGKVRMVRQKDNLSPDQQTMLQQLKDLAGSWALMLMLHTLRYPSLSNFMDTNPVTHCNAACVCIQGLQRD